MRQETGAGRGFSNVMSEKLGYFDLASEFSKYLRILIANRKYKLAVAATN